MSELQEIGQFISTIGFPIAACGMLFYLYDKTIKDLTIMLSKMDTTLDGIIKRLDMLDKEHEN